MDFIPLITELKPIQNFKLLKIKRHYKEVKLLKTRYYGIRNNRCDV